MSLLLIIIRDIYDSFYSISTCYFHGDNACLIHQFYYAIFLIFNILSLTHTIWICLFKLDSLIYFSVFLIIRF